jgi:hypothetical protein
MKKKIICVSLILIFVFTLIAVVIFMTQCKRDDGIEILTPERAISLAKGFLLEHYGSRANYDIIDFIAEENDGVWIVRSVTPPPVVMEDGRMMVTFGFEYYIHIRKDNGELLEIGMR